jgi:tetratricopeptide (TPR) repeat protein
MSDEQDVKKGDTILARIGDHAHNVAVGKNIIQIGQLSIPGWLVLLFAFGIVIGISLLILNAYQAEDARKQLQLAALPTPTATPIPRMPGTFNIFVAEFGELDENGGVQKSPYGQILSLAVYETLNRIYNDLGGDVLAGVEIWHDDPEFTETGPIQGDKAEDRERSANQIAQQIRADMIIYGNLASMGNEDILTLDFYFHSKQIWTAPDVVAGTYLLGQPIPVRVAFRHDSTQAKRLVEDPLRIRSQALFWMTMGLSFSVTDQTEESVAILRQVEEKAPNWRDQDGKWILYYLWGREEATLRNYDAAIDLFQRAIGLNEDFVNAYIGLGYVYYDRAQIFFARNEQLPEALAGCRLAQNIDQGASSLADALADIDQSIALYNDALSRIPEASNSEMRSMVQQALGLSYRLQAQAQLWIAYEQQVAGESYWPILALSEELLNNARDEFSQTLEPFQQDSQYSLLALSHWGTGNADRFLAHIRLLEAGDAQAEGATQLATTKRSEAITFLEGSLAHYAICISQEANLTTDLLSKTRIIECACKPAATEAQAVLNQEQSIVEMRETSE